MPCMTTTLADFHAPTLTGTDRDLADYVGNVVVVVNTASKCGLVGQFEGLESLYKEFADRGLVVLGFPCGQFAGQELDSADEIGEFCQVNYGVTFPMFAKIDVNGRHADPLYKWLKSEKKDGLGKSIKWNFTKFLLNREGQVIARYAPNTEPADMANDIRAALAVKV